MPIECKLIYPDGALVELERTEPSRASVFRNYINGRVSYLGVECVDMDLGVLFHALEKRVHIRAIEQGTPPVELLSDETAIAYMPPDHSCEVELGGPVGNRSTRLLVQHSLELL